MLSRRMVTRKLHAKKNRKILLRFLASDIDPSKVDTEVVTPSFMSQF